MKDLRMSITVAVISGCLLLASSIVAGEKPRAENGEADSAVVENAKRPRASFVLDGLHHAVDLWYDAILKNDQDLARRYEQLIDNILYEDLAATEKEYVNAKLDSSQQEPTKQVSARGLSEDFLRRQLEVKQQIAQAVHEEPGFSRKYRLLGGYINALRKELGLPELKFADEQDILNEE